MTGVLRRLLALAAAPRRRLAAAVALGALTVAFGAGLMAAAGYLISRAAEKPAILSLSLVIVAVRFFGLARPVTRYLERLAAHDVALRVLARVRVQVFHALEPLAPARLEGFRDGDLLARLVGDVDALQDLHLRAIGPPLVAVLAGALTVGAAAAVLPAAGGVLAAGLLVGGVLVPVLSARIGGRVAAREAAARGRLTAELVDALEHAPELVAYGAHDAALARVRAADAALVRLGRRDALAGGMESGVLPAVTGATVAGVLAVAVAATAGGALDRTLVALLGLLALAAFEAVEPLPGAARRLSATLAAGARVLEVVDRTPAVADPGAPAPVPDGPVTVCLEDVSARYAGEDRLALEGVSLRLAPGARTALVGPSGAGKTTVVNLLLRFLEPARGRITLGGRDLRELRQDDVRAAIALAGQDSHLFAATIRENLLVARPGAGDDELEAVLRRARLWSFVAANRCESWPARAITARTSS